MTPAGSVLQRTGSGDVVWKRARGPDWPGAWGGGRPVPSPGAKALTDPKAGPIIAHLLALCAGPFRRIRGLPYAHAGPPAPLLRDGNWAEPNTAVWSGMGRGEVRHTLLFLTPLSLSTRTYRLHATSDIHKHAWLPSPSPRLRACSATSRFDLSQSVIILSPKDIVCTT